MLWKTAFTKFTESTLEYFAAYTSFSKNNDIITKKLKGTKLDLKSTFSREMFHILSGNQSNLQTITTERSTF